MVGLDKMRIKSLEVEGLFGTFHHVIDMNDGGITILMGENGIGKTATLEVINDFFNFNFDRLIEKEFNAITFTFDDNEQYVISKVLKRIFIRKVTKVKNIWYDFTSIKKSDVDNYLNSQFNKTINDGIKKISQMRLFTLADLKSHDLWESEIIDKHIKAKFSSASDVEDLISIYDRGDKIKNDNITAVSKLQKIIIQKILDGEVHFDKDKIPSWFYKILSGVNSKLIETQRIITVDNEIKSRSTVSVCSENLKSELEKATYKANAVSSKLDSSFPNRLMVALRRRKIEELDKINELLDKLDEYRGLFSAVGILGDVKKNELELFKHDTKKEDNKSILNMISLYIEDSYLKLQPYEELYHKLELFLRLINSRLRHKKIIACRKDGISIVSTVEKNYNNKPLSDTKIIPIDKLSSGEQHEIILFFKLIFNQPDGSLVLIDEPELSLHISWQNEFINDLKEIISLKNLSVIISTHSPDIIGQHWSLTQELSGPNEQ